MDKDTQDTQQIPKKRGRKPTGRKRRQMYLTDEEREQLMILLHDIRHDEPPVRYNAIKTQADEEYTAAIKREAQGSHRPVHTIGYYRAETLYRLIDLPCKPAPYSREVTRMKDQLERERWQRQGMTDEELRAKRADEEIEQWKHINAEWLNP